METEVLLDQKKAFIRALIAAKKEMGHIKKDTRGVFNSMHATLESCIEVIEPALNKHGLVTMQGMEGRNLITRIMHQDGYEVEFCRELPPPQGENLNHADGGATTYFRRYDYLAIVNQQPEGEDHDGGAPTRPQGSYNNQFRGPSQQQASRPAADPSKRIFAKAMEIPGWNSKTFTDWLFKNYGVMHTMKLPQEKMQEVEAQIDALKDNLDSGFARSEDAPF